MLKRLIIVFGVLFIIAIITIGSMEIYHRVKFGDFFGYGIHTDVVLGNSDIGMNDMHYAELWNVSIFPFEIEGCKFPSDLGGVPDSVLYRWDVQKQAPANHNWVSLHGADNWVSEPFGGSWKEEHCYPVKTQIIPFQRRKIAWVYKDWVTTREPIRMAIHTSTTKPAEQQNIIYTNVFVMETNKPK